MNGCVCVDEPPAGYSIPAPPTLYCSSDSFKVEAERTGNQRARTHTHTHVQAHTHALTLKHMVYIANIQ